MKTLLRNPMNISELHNCWKNTCYLIHEQLNLSVLGSQGSSLVTKILVKIGPIIFHKVRSAMSPLCSSSTKILVNESCSAFFHVLLENKERVGEVI